MKALRQTLLIFAIALVGCSLPASRQDRTAEPRLCNPDYISRNVLAAVQAIHFEDGVDESEANALVSIYFRNTYGACGMWGPIRERNQDWFFPCASGFVAVRQSGITVAKQGLLMTCRNGPVVTNALLLAKIFDPAWRMSPLNRSRK